MSPDPEKLTEYDKPQPTRVTWRSWPRFLLVVFLGCAVMAAFVIVVILCGPAVKPGTWMAALALPTGLFLVAVGLFMDVCSLVWGLRRVLRGHGPSGVLVFPLIFYWPGLTILSNVGLPPARFFWPLAAALVSLHLLGNVVLPWIALRWGDRSPPPKQANGPPPGNCSE
jgi:hypothetical protein